MSTLFLCRAAPLVLVAGALCLRDAAIPATDNRDTQEVATMLDSTPLKNLKPLLGSWEGEISGADASGNAWAVPIRWISASAFEGRYLRFEFTSVEPRPNGSYLEYEALFVWNNEEKRVETIWMSPRLRVPGATKYLDGPMIFFETGIFDDSGKVLTLTSQQKQTKEAESKPVRSTFRLIDPDHFTIVDEHLDEATGTWSASGTFTLQRVK